MRKTGALEAIGVDTKVGDDPGCGAVDAADTDIAGAYREATVNTQLAHEGRAQAMAQLISYGRCIGLGMCRRTAVVNSALCPRRNRVPLPRCPPLDWVDTIVTTRPPPCKVGSPGARSRPPGATQMSQSKIRDGVF